MEYTEKVVKNYAKPIIVIVLLAPGVASFVAAFTHFYDALPGFFCCVASVLLLSGSFLAVFYGDCPRINRKIYFLHNVKPYMANTRIVKVERKVVNKNRKKPLIGSIHYFVTIQLERESEGEAYTLKTSPMSYGKSKIGETVTCLSYEYYDVFNELIYSEIKEIA